MGDRICSVSAREILGPHGFPTVEAQVITEKGHTGKGLVPWGMSVGKYESSVPGLSVIDFPGFILPN